MTKNVATRVACIVIATLIGTSAGSTISAQTMPVSATPPYFEDPTRPISPPATFIPSMHGAWAGPFSWHSQICASSGCSTNALPGYSDYEVGHATLIVTGPERGKVLLWHWDVTPGATTLNGPTTRAWLFDPSNPGTLQSVPTSLQDDLFCSGHCVLPDGRIFIGGGLQSGFSPTLAPRACYVFDPIYYSEADVPPGGGGANDLPPGPPGPWLGPISNFTSTRYYPTAGTLNRAFGGDALVLGGTDSLNNTLGIVPIERWNGIFDGSSVPSSSANVSEGFEWYPRFFQLSNGQVFVLGDVAANVVASLSSTTAPRTNSFPGNCWLINLPPTGLTGTTVQTATHPSTIQTPNPALSSIPPQGVDYFDRGYAPAVLLHCLPGNGGVDRVFYFGGREGTDEVDTTTGGFRRPTYRARIHRNVQEFQIGSTGPSGTPGVWFNRASMYQRRHLFNAVTLPTGEVFLHGGEWQDHDQDASSSSIVSGIQSFDHPVFLPEIYTPGNATTPSSTRWAAIPNPGLDSVDGSGVTITRPIVCPYTPRTYHSVAMLLPDGRVFVAGGQDYNPGTVAAAQNIDPAMQDSGTIGQWLAFASHTGEIYSPPYLYQGPRPSIVAAPDRAVFGGGVTIEVASANSGPIDSVVLIRGGAVTHHFNVDQRYIECSATVISGALPTTNLRIRVVMPAATLATQGYYMMFVVQNNGGNRIPSTASFIQLL